MDLQETYRLAGWAVKTAGSRVGWHVSAQDQEDMKQEAAITIWELDGREEQYSEKYLYSGGKYAALKWWRYMVLGVKWWKDAGLKTVSIDNDDKDYHEVLSELASDPYIQEPSYAYLLTDDRRRQKRRSQVDLQPGESFAHRERN